MYFVPNDAVQLLRKVYDFSDFVLARIMVEVGKSLICLASRFNFAYGNLEKVLILLGSFYKQFIVCYRALCPNRNRNRSGAVERSLR